MQVQSQKLILPKIPEYYLYWAFEKKDYLVDHLHTTAKESLQIIDSGTRNLDNGPDFLNAILKIDGVMCRGDVEFHLFLDDWYKHGHHNDLRYQRVILHVLWYSPECIPDELNSRFAHLIISQFLRITPNSWVKKMRALESSSLSPLELRQIFALNSADLETMAWRRFERKCEELNSWLKNYQWETTLYMGLARALGYGKNSSVFQELVRNLPPVKLLKIVPPFQRSPLVFWLILLQQGGLLDTVHSSFKDDTSANVKHSIDTIRRQYESLLPLQKQHLLQWSFSRLRPPNNPYLRIAGYAQILYRYQNDTLFQTILEIFVQRDSLCELLKSLEKLLRIPISPVFTPYFRALLGLEKWPTFTLGRQRCYQFILNILLPLMYLWGEKHHNPGFLIYLEDLYFNFPVVDNNSLLRIAKNSLQDIPFNKAYLQQAALEFFLQK